MKDYQISNLKNGIFAGAVWLFGLGALVLASPTGADSLPARVLTGGISIAGALFLLWVGLYIKAADDNSMAVAVEAARHFDRTRRVA